MENPLVSVVITTYNRQATLSRAVLSVLAQTYVNLEVIVVDDASTDGTKNIIAAIKDPRILFLQNEKNVGVVVSANAAIARAAGKYIARLDDDDYWCSSDKLTKQVEFLENHPDHVMVGGGFIKTDYSGREFIRSLFPEHDADIRKKLLIINIIANGTVLFRRDAFQKAGGYNVDFDALEDWELWLRLGRLGKLHMLQEFFTVYAGHDFAHPGYLEKKYGKLQSFKRNLALRTKYKNEYPGYLASVLYYLVSYAYSFLPIRNKLEPLVWRLRTVILRKPYKITK